MSDHPAPQTALFGDIFEDVEAAACLDDAALARAMLRVEAGLAEAQAGLGMIPEAAGRAIAAAAGTLHPDHAALAQGVAQSGVPVPALVAALRAETPPPHNAYVHWGATSQDIVDTAFVLQFAEVLALLETRLGAVIDDLSAQSQQHAGLVMLGRTRSQVATPITFGLRLAQWAQPLIGAEARLGTVRTQLLRVQFGGAVGARTALAPHGPAVSKALADTLGLGDAPPWHTDRSAIRALALWLGDVLAGLGKMANDIVLMGRSEISELRAGAGGGSSTMPHKANPVGAEAILSLQRLAVGLQSSLWAAGPHAEERDGGAWAVEWQVLPQLCVATAAALRHAKALTSDITPDVAAMTGCVAAHPEAMAEAATFALVPAIGRDAAQALVRDALSKPDFAKAMANAGPAEIDWISVLDPRGCITPAKEVAASILSARGR